MSGASAGFLYHCKSTISMTRIGLLSDTHGYIDDQILRLLSEVDEIWHAGDIGDLKVMDQLASIRPVVAVWGNIDGGDARQRYPQDVHAERDGVSLMMTHIGGRPGKYPDRVKAQLRAHQPDVFICGHSHITLVKHDPSYNVLHMNPGAAGRHGFHKMRTLLRFTADKGKLSDLELVELGPRSSNAIDAAD
jgi:putative phosphoesterase